jgi:hypothetical protein
MRLEVIRRFASRTSETPSLPAAAYSRFRFLRNSNCLAMSTCGLNTDAQLTLPRMTHLGRKSPLGGHGWIS